MRSIEALTLVALLAGCAGGVDDPRPVTLEWDRSPYVSSGTDRAVDAVVTLGGTAVPHDVAIEVRATQGGIVVDVPSKRMDAQRRLPLTLRPEPDARGAYVVTATAVVEGVVHSATTMVVVPD